MVGVIRWRSWTRYCKSHVFVVYLPHDTQSIIFSLPSTKFPETSGVLYGQDTRGLDDNAKTLNERLAMPEPICYINPKARVKCSLIGGTFYSERL